jgi:hypothetical protein
MPRRRLATADDLVECYQKGYQAGLREAKGIALQHTGQTGTPHTHLNSCPRVIAEELEVAATRKWSDVPQRS